MAVPRRQIWQCQQGRYGSASKADGSASKADGNATYLAISVVAPGSKAPGILILCTSLGTRALGAINQAGRLVVCLTLLCQERVASAG